MALEIKRQTLEVENLIGARRTQALVRAEALVPGAGREAIEPLLADAGLFIEKAEVQADRVVIEGAVACQAVYRQGEECAVRALTAQAQLSHVLEIPGAQPGMFARVRGEVEHVDARYENGHMVFQVTCGLRAQVLRLAPAALIDGVEGQSGLQTVYRTLDSVRLAAESSEMALLRDSVALPAALDARATLMDWVSVQLDEAKPDLGGVRVKGRAMVETLVASGAAGRPAVLVRYPLALDQLVELPEWLTGDVFAETAVRAVRTRVEPAEEGGDMTLACEVELRVSVLANAESSASALTDIYATQGDGLALEREPLELCAGASRESFTETVRGTVMIGENAPGVGTVLAAQVHPVIGGIGAENGQGRVEGILEASVLYMPGGSELPAAAQAELPFSLAAPMPLDEDDDVTLTVLSAEASALMSDRLEMKVQLGVICERRRRERVEIVTDVRADAPIERRPGIIICFPDADEDAWALGKRYAVPPERCAIPEDGGAVIIRI